MSRTYNLIDDTYTCTGADPITGHMVSHTHSSCTLCVFCVSSAPPKRPSNCNCLPCQAYRSGMMSTPCEWLTSEIKPYLPTAVWSGADKFACTKHTWSTYVGFTDTFEYCSVCDVKKDDVEGLPE